jgi:threonine/homoserine/homoserine lactone efflux protein
MDFVIFLRGVIIGLMVSLPMGPIGVLVLQRTLNRGRLNGFMSGMGAATADTIFALVAVFGMKFVIEFITTYKPLLEVIGGILIVFIGARIFNTHPGIQIRKHRQKPSPAYRDYFSALALTLSNPLYIFVFIAFFAGVNLVSDNHVLKNLPYFIIVIGVSTGTFCWYFILSTLANVFRGKLRLKRLFWINRISGTVIIVFGLFAISDAFIHWQKVLSPMNIFVR